MPLWVSCQASRHPLPMQPQVPFVELSAMCAHCSFGSQAMQQARLLLLAGARQEELARAAEEGAAWIDFQRMAAWWLGEHANVATDEYAGSSGISPSPTEDDVLATSGFGRVVINTENKPLSAGEVHLTVSHQPQHAHAPN